MVVWGRDFGQIVSSVYYPSSKFGAIIHSRSQKSHRGLPFSRQDTRSSFVVFVADSLFRLFGDLGSRQVSELVPSWSSIDI